MNEESHNLQLVGLVVVDEVLDVCPPDTNVALSHSLIKLVPAQVASRLWIVIESREHFLDSVLWNSSRSNKKILKSPSSGSHPVSRNHTASSCSSALT